jgi:nicotinate-nucleotide adenylyltransferase
MSDCRFARYAVKNIGLPFRPLVSSVGKRPLPGARVRARLTFVKIGFLGGSFDPVHFGHLVAARDACEHCMLDRIILVPAARAPLKATAAAASPEDRLAMLRAAVVDEPRFSVSDHELRRGGVSFTIDSVRHFAAEFPGAQLYWIIGADQVARLPRWKEIVELASAVEFVVVGRPGFVIRRPRGLPNLRLHRCPGHRLDLSSTDLRARARQGLPLDWLTPHKTVVYLQRKRLYR